MNLVVTKKLFNKTRRNGLTQRLAADVNILRDIFTLLLVGIRYNQRLRETFCFYVKELWLRYQAYFGITYKKGFCSTFFKWDDLA